METGSDRRRFGLTQSGIQFTIDLPECAVLWPLFVHFDPIPRVEKISWQTEHPEEEGLERRPVT